MSARSTPTILYVQDLLARDVVDADGKKLGHVYGVVAKPDGEDLCVAAIVVGAGSWLGRFGWKQEEGGRHVPWEDIAAFEPQIRLRRGAEGGE